MKVTEVIKARSHRNIRATHKTTFEITKETELTRRGDCIIAIGATKGAVDLSPDFREAAKRKGAQITITIETGHMKEVVRARGSPRLSFLHLMDLVVRKSDYVCSRTIAIRADKAANDLSRKLVTRMQDSRQGIRITLTVDAH